MTIEIATASIKAVRGYSICAALIDEIAFLPQEDSASPDFEILDSIRPAMATIPGAVMICASSPYARRGALWDLYKRYFGKDDAPVLIWQAATRVMNPTVPQSVIDLAMERDAASASAEYMAQFRLDIEAFISREAVEACVDVDVYERAPFPGLRYFGFTDAAGGSGQRSYTVAVAHQEGELVFLDCVREVKPPFSPEAVTKQFAELLRILSHLDGPRRPVWWRVAARAIQKARRSICASRQDHQRELRRDVAAHQFWQVFFVR